LQKNPLISTKILQKGKISHFLKKLFTKIKLKFEVIGFIIKKL